MFPLPTPELSGFANPERVVDARVAQPGILMTPEARTTSRVVVNTDLIALNQANAKYQDAEANTRPGGNVSVLLANVDRRGPSGGGRDTFRRQIRTARVASQQEAVQKAYDNRKDTQDHLLHTISESNPDDHIDTISDALAGAINAEDSATDMVIESDTAGRWLQRVEDDRLLRLYDRMRADAAHPTPDVALQRIREARLRRLAFEAIQASLGQRGNPDARLARGREATAADGAYARALETQMGGLADQITKAADLLKEHVLNIGRAERVNDLQVERLSTWRIGDNPDYADQPGHITNLHEVEAGIFDRISLRSTRRHELLTGATIDRFRAAERLVLCPDQSINTGPHAFSPDGGILIDRGRTTIYDDGSQQQYGDVRRTADGEVWTGRALDGLPAPGWYGNNWAAGQDDATLETYAADMRDTWEEARGASTENDSLHMDRLLIDRYELRIGERTAAIVAGDMRTVELNTTEIPRLGVEYATLDGKMRIKYGSDWDPTTRTLTIDYTADRRTIKQAEHDRDTIVAAAHNLQNAKNEVTTLVSDRIAHQNAINVARTRENATQYWLGRHLVNTGEIMPSGDPRAMTDYQGGVFVRDTTLNGLTGNWLIQIDGSASLYDNSGALKNNYRPDGTII